MKKKLENFLYQIENIGGESNELIFESPASEQDILAVENELGYQIPKEFRNVLLTLSKHCEFAWFLPDNFELPKELSGLFCGEVHWGIDFILKQNQKKDRWIKKVFPDVNNEYDQVWHYKFVFQEVGNGDFLSIDLNEKTLGQIVYLSHDHGEGHGYVMARSFTELLSNWGELGFPGAEDFQWLPFTNEMTTPIDLECQNAKIWKKRIGR